ncbi:NTP pyrophosphatase, house-cleaning of non-canonical NTPs [Chryseobacterium oleae]|uniref:NTP pyrophosphatase, house-cleaning of non-canonical NTPs n=1 Tax=Chryseobacterium oleae TaxID=491207 RepID=A0A1I4VUY3_CHROL|nr:nucleotide pyrophosphohydrolase [Chryseobacterium oleae]SFN04826.1 NTP pyrophosphatase, house-cleaning of non-canonical NTPs [Chryseobacterium oleae]
MIDTETLEKLLKFRDDRDWEQFHNSKDLALALSIEASELLEIFLWKKDEDFSKDKLEEELADVFMYGLLLAHKNNIDINNIILKKLHKNDEKYPVNKAKGRADKYDEL